MSGQARNHQTVPSGRRLVVRRPGISQGRPIFGVAFLLAMAVLLAACAAEPDDIEQVDEVDEPDAPDVDEPDDEDDAVELDEPATGGTLTVGVPEQLETLNPVPHPPQVFSEMIGQALYDTLWRIESDGTLSPHVAEEWEVSDDELETTIQIRDDVEFHDGSPLTAEDIAYSIGLRFDPELIAEAATLGLMAEEIFDHIEVVDDTTVRVVTTEPFRVPEILGYNSRIVPANAHEELGETLEVESVGTGPFEVEEFVAGSHVTVVANDNYWGGRPSLDQITFAFFDDFGALAANFHAGDVDAIYQVQAFQMQDVEGVADKETLEIGSYSVWWMPQMGQPPLDDPDVRRALRYAIDMERINEIAFAGEGTLTWTYLDQTDWASGEQVDVEYDPERAAELLEEAGAAGASIPLTAISGNEIAQRSALIIQEGFREAGLESDVRLVSSGEWFGLAYGARDWEGLIQNTGTPYPYPPNWTLDFTVAQSSTASAFTDDPPHPEMTNLMRAIPAALDEGEFDSLIQEADALIADEALVFPTPFAPVRLLVPDDLDGVLVNDFGHIFFEDAHFGS